MLSFDIVASARGAVSRTKLGHYLRLPLFANAIYLLAANGIAPVLGMAYWVLAARLYSTEAVGFTSAVMAGVGVINLICHLGLGVGLVRFLHGTDKNPDRVLNTVYTVGILAPLIGALIFLAGIHVWSPPLISLRENAFYFGMFVAFVIAYNMGILVDDTFVAARRASFVFVRSLLFNLLKLALLAAVAAALPLFGILASWTAALWVSLLALVVLLPRVQAGYRPRMLLDIRVLKELLPFSLANELGAILSMAPSMLFPILVIGLLGAEPTAYFSIAAAVTSPLTMVSGAFSTSLFAEGSYEEGKLAVNTRRTLVVTFVILVPGVILALVLAPYILALFGRGYANEGAGLLRILAVAALPLAFNNIYVAIKRIEKKLKVIVGLSALGVVATLALTYYLVPRMGINGAGVASLGSQVIVSLVITGSWLRKADMRQWLSGIPFSRR